MESQSQDDFKWFGEGFDGFPRKLPEDTIEYAIHMIDGKLQATRKLARLRQVLQDVNLYSKDLLKDYIWQRDPFKVELKLNDGSWSLQGRSNFGDSISDEWLIVYILVETSKRHPDVWIRTYDTDGEFLLIEAANVLPKWLKPEISENRVWIHAGEIRIIPLIAQTPLATQVPGLRDAISFINSNSNQLFRSVQLEQEAFYRIKKYPTAIPDHFHHSLITIPRKIAYILHENPAWISPAVEAFYLRDPISLKPLLSSINSTFEFPPTDLVTTSIRFTRVSFAQLTSQEFDPPPSWTKLTQDASTATLPHLLVGMKLTCGFEMLLTDCLHASSRAVAAVKVLLEDLKSGDVELPTDDEVAGWSRRDDDEGWIDIDFNEFERELQGERGPGDGFGDKAAQENLRKMVKRVEEFLGNENAGVDGAEMESEEESDSDEESEDEEGDIEFDEREFERMMREMLGLSTAELGHKPLANTRPVETLEESSDDEQGIKEAMEGMEAELKETGVLNLDSAPELSTKAKGKARAITSAGEEIHQDVEVINEPIDIDFTLAKNMLQAFKSQGGMAGPAGNLMGLMGVHMPPDKDDEKTST